MLKTNDKHQALICSEYGQSFPVLIRTFFSAESSQYFLERFQIVGFGVV